MAQIRDITAGIQINRELPANYLQSADAFLIGKLHSQVIMGSDIGVCFCKASIQVIKRRIVMADSSNERFRKRLFKKGISRNL